ncbi:MAG TPA: GAF domain-containing protein, partial [Candidatus Methanoperedens sp.]|nr:GAF domain-containing protein [Candidatus Methanoperedens sp.]
MPQRGGTVRVYLVSRKNLIVILRWLLFFVVCYLVVSGEERASRIQLPLLAVFVASNVALGFVSQERFRRLRLNYAVVVFDVAFISAMIYLTGDLDLYIFYFFVILMSSYGRQIQVSLLVAVLASGFYVWMAVRTGSVETLMTPALLIRIPFFYLVALISSFMAEESREEEERLAWTRIVLGMTQELATARDRQQACAILRETLLRFPRVRDLRLLIGAGEGFRDLDAGETGRTWNAAEFGLAAELAGAAGAPFFQTLLPSGPAADQPHPSGALLVAGFPFALHGGARGLLLVYPSGSEEFGARACEMFTIAAMSLAHCLERLDAFDEVSRRAAEVGSLMELSQVINSTLDLSEVLRQAMAQSTRLLGAEASALMLLDEATQELTFEVATGDKGEEIKHVRLKLGEGVAGWVVREGRPLVVNDPEADPRFSRRADAATGHVTRNILAVPLQVRGRVLGVLEVLNSLPPGRPFGDEDLRLLQAVENQAGTAIEKARLYKYMEEQVNETIEMYFSLEKEKGKIEAILASMVEGVVVCDEQGSVILVNERARLALSNDGISWLPEHGRVLELLQRARSEHREFSDSIAPDTPGRRIHRVRVAPMRTAAGKFLGAVAVLEDATELTRLSELKSEFISQVSHELRTPLTSMRGALGLLARGRAGPVSPEQLGLIALVQEEVGRMTALINDLLDLSKLESGMARLELEELAVQPLAERLLDGLRILLAEKLQEVVWEWASELPRVRADRRRLERVFANLIGNAIKYTPAGGTIRIGADPRPGGAQGAGGAGARMLRCWVR